MEDGDTHFSCGGASLMILKTMKKEETILKI